MIVLVCAWQSAKELVTRNPAEPDKLEGPFTMGLGDHESTVTMIASCASMLHKYVRDCAEVGVIEVEDFAHQMGYTMKERYCLAYSLHSCLFTICDRVQFLEAWLYPLLGIARKQGCVHISRCQDLNHIRIHQLYPDMEGLILQNYHPRLVMAWNNRNRSIDNLSTRAIAI